MSDVATEVRKLLGQQAAIAGFGSFALRQSDLLKILNEAAKVCAEELGVPFAKVCRFRPEENDLFIEAGYGWKEGVVGTAESADPSSPQGRAFVSGQPSVYKDITKDIHFNLPSFYAAHDIVSTVDVVIHVKDHQPYGVLEIDNDRQYDYDEHDITFLTAFANVLAEAVATATRLATLRAVIEEKDRLIDQKNTLAEELQHRVRNNMQLVYGMLSKQVDDTRDLAAKRGIKSIARRVSTIALVFDHLLGDGVAHTTDFGNFVKSLCANITEIQATTVNLECECDRLMLDLDMVTTLGIVVAELVTNSFDHAFPLHEGLVRVSFHDAVADDDMATLKISDNGTGFVPDYKSKRQGLGLVQRLIEQVHGAIWVESHHGTAWTVKFPVKAPPVPG